MKYLKLFENFESDGYIALPETFDINDNPEGDKLWQKHDVIKFRDKTYNEISNLLVNGAIPSIKKFNNSEDCYMIISHRSEIGSVVIWECEDEWFRVSISFGSMEYQSYVCDQLFGLKNLLKKYNLVK